MGIIIESGKGQCLSVVDMNKDFVLPDGKLPVPGILGEPDRAQQIARILRLTRLPFDVKEAVADGHVPDHCEFALYGEHAVINTPGQRYIDQLWSYWKDANYRIKKGKFKDVFSYSIATSPQFLYHIGALREKGVKEIFIAGLVYHICVGESAIAYAMQNFEVYVVRDCCRSLSEAGVQMMDERLKSYGVGLINSTEIL